jgi:ribonuclease BN (tRNA processing enzyme)
MCRDYSIEWIGTGSGLNLLLGNTSFIISRENRKLLVDCGFTVPTQLMKQEKLKDITDIVITHTHSDHIGGLEQTGFMNYFVYRRTGNDRPKLHVGSESMVGKIWSSLKEGMETGQWYTQEILDHCSTFKEDFNAMISKGLKKGLYKPFTLNDYFNISVGKTIGLDGSFKIQFIPKLHAPFMENYGLSIGKNVYYSGDSIELPPSYPELIFQDCQFYDGGVHISYDALKSRLPLETKAKTYLVHLGGGWNKKSPQKDGFAGFVKPGDLFSFQV